MQLSVAKNEVISFGAHCPPRVTLPSFSIPPDPVTGPHVSWSPDPLPRCDCDWNAHPPESYTTHKDYTVGAVPRVAHIVHLGQPLTPSLSHESVFAPVLDELEDTLHVLGTQPLPPLARGGG